MKNEYVKSVVVLSVICLVVALLLGVTNAFTAPLIAEVNEQAAKSACYIVMKDAQDFERVEKTAAIPENVNSIFKETSGMGYVFEVSVTGYNPGLVIAVGISADGLVTDTYTVSTGETPTIGGKTQEASYTEQYVGKDSSLEGVDSITGATMTSRGYKNAVTYAFEAYNVLMGGN